MKERKEKDTMRVPGIDLNAQVPTLKKPPNLLFLITLEETGNNFKWTLNTKNPANANTRQFHECLKAQRFID